MTSNSLTKNWFRFLETKLTVILHWIVKNIWIISSLFQDARVTVWSSINSAESLAELNLITITTNKKTFLNFDDFDHPFQVNSTLVNSLFLEIKVYFFLWKKLTWRPLIHQNSKNSWTRKSSSSFQLEWPWKAFYVVSIHLWIWSWTSRLEPTKPGKLENSRKKNCKRMNSCKKFIIYNIQRKRIHRNDCGSRKFMCDDGGKRPYLLNY